MRCLAGSTRKVKMLEQDYILKINQLKHKLGCEINFKSEDQEVYYNSPACCTESLNTGIPLSIPPCTSCCNGTRVGVSPGWKWMVNEASTSWSVVSLKKQKGNDHEGNYIDNGRAKEKRKLFSLLPQARNFRCDTVVVRSVCSRDLCKVRMLRASDATLSRVMLQQCQSNNAQASTA